MNAATVVTQSQATPAALAAALRGWLDDAGRRSQAVLALRAWDITDATERIVARIEGAAK
jgi:UDP-N-acetylglucosamine:LPS N-acetylglucosamine transferase